MALPPLPRQPTATLYQFNLTAEINKAKAAEMDDLDGGGRINLWSADLLSADLGAAGPTAAGCGAELGNRDASA
jgi:hypothetical protein